MKQNDEYGAFKRKGKERKGKGLLYLAVIVAFLSVSAMACKNRGTGTILDGAMPIDLTQDVSQFEGKTFKSINVIEENMGGYYLWVKITEDSTIKYQGANTEPDFSGGEVIVAKGLGQDYTFTGKNYNKPQSGNLVFEPDGTLTVKFVSGTSYDGKTVKCKWTDLK